MAKEYEVAKTLGTCITCEKQLQPGDEFFATLTDQGEQLVRQEYCTNCWTAESTGENPQLLGYWRSRVPEPQEKKKKLFVDDELLVNFFQRLEDTEEESKINFRYVLGLILMRKKIMIYEKSEKLDDGRDLWHVRLRGDDKSYKLIDPRLDEERISQVSDQLSEILEGEL